MSKGVTLKLTIILCSVLMCTFQLQTFQRNYEQTVACILTKTNLPHLTIGQICKQSNNSTVISQSCANSFHSLELCLILNNCYSQQAKQSKLIPYNCWHCWAHLEADPLMKEFQDKFNGPNVCFEGITKITSLLLTVLGCLMII